MHVVDTNVLVYAANRGAPEHQRCRDLLQEWGSGHSSWYTTWSRLYEFLRVVTHARVLDRPWSMDQAIEFVRVLLLMPGHRVLQQSERHVDVLRELTAEYPLVSGNLVHDFHTAVLMREHGLARIYTRDTDFHRFSFLEVIDPLAV